MDLSSRSEMLLYNVRFRRIPPRRRFLEKSPAATWQCTTCTMYAAKQLRNFHQLKHSSQFLRAGLLRECSGKLRHPQREALPCMVTLTSIFGLKLLSNSGHVKVDSFCNLRKCTEKCRICTLGYDVKLYPQSWPTAEFRGVFTGLFLGNFPEKSHV
jgi:hypothetical protein